MSVLKLRLKQHIVRLLLSTCLSGCMVGPNFHTPPQPVVERYTESPLPAKTVNSPGSGKAGVAQKFVVNKDIPAEWWQLFHSPAINQLIERGFINSPNLASAYAALRQAEETLNVQIGNSMFPAINITGSAERQRFSLATLGAPPRGITFNLFSTSATLSYTLDVFGGARREIESLRAQVDYQQFELLAAYLTLASNIVATSVNIASFKAQINATNSLIKAQQGLLDIFKQQYRLGGVSNANVLTQQTLVEQTRATLPPLQKSLSLAKHSLSVLVGEFPNAIMPEINLDKLVLPRDIPISLPSNIIRQRPDVLASEALLHAACAQIGVATANLFPQFTINGSYGWISNMLSNLFNNQNKVWNLIGQVTQPVFHGGALFAQRRANIAAFEQAGAQYQQTILQAFQNVADALRALETDARTLRAQKNAEDSARASLELIQSQFRLGGVSYINLLNAQQQYQQTLISRIQAQAARFSDTVTLFQALGGGWWNGEPAQIGG